MFNYYNYALVATPSDTVDLPNGPCDAIYTGSESSINVVLESGDTVLFTTVPKGFIVPIRAKRINASSTGTGPFVALYRK